ncbi:putative target of rapamycin (TOR) kinase 1 [Trypanosoma cruzi]|nr:putative target of rapamycin (TOR) kinase 1 [Trypanosoma cruzi]
MTRLATPQDEHAIPLQQFNVPVLNLEWIKGRLNPATLESLMQVWGLVGRSPFPLSSLGKAREGSRRIPTADAHLLRNAGIIEDASSTITGGWIIPFSVVEEKTTGLRRRWIAWPRDKNRDDPSEAHAPLLHISHYLPPVMAEAASCLDLKTTFFQVSLPRETRHLFRCRVEVGTLVELTRLPMGYKVSPEILQIIITSTIAGVTAVNHRLWAAPPLVRDDVWIDDTRIAGSKSDETLWEAQVLRNADGRRATMGEDRESGATQYTFLGEQFGHTHQAVSLSDKFVRSVRAMPALNSSTIAEMEVTVSRFLYLAAILGTQLCDHYFFIKAVRRRLSALNRGIVLETSPANLPPSAVGLGEGLRQINEDNRKRTIESTEKASAAIIADASLHGWGAVFVPDSGDVKIAGENGRGSLFLSCRSRRAGYAWPYRPFPPSRHPPWTFGWIMLRCEEWRIKAARNHTP